MNFEEASKMKEGTMFNVIQKNGGGWLNCYFEYGIVHTKIGGKLAATLNVFTADWKLVDDWNWFEQYNLIMYDLQRYLSPEQLGNVSDKLLKLQEKQRDLILKDFDLIDEHPDNKCDLMMSDIYKIINKRFGDLK